jgi:hypothetical protein
MKLGSRTSLPQQGVKPGRCMMRFYTLAVVRDAAGCDLSAARGNQLAYPNGTKSTHGELVGARAGTKTAPQEEPSSLRTIINGRGN